MTVMNIPNDQIDINSLKRDFCNLLEEYWVSVNTKCCTPFPNELENNRNFAKKLIEKYKII